MQKLYQTPLGIVCSLRHRLIDVPMAGKPRRIERQEDRKRVADKRVYVEGKNGCQIRVHLLAGGVGDSLIVQNDVQQ
jgi:hypothetical protein